MFERYKEIVDDYDAFRESLEKPLPVTCWANPERVDRETLMNELGDETVSPEPLDCFEWGIRLPSHCRLGKNWRFFAGLLQIQEQASMIPPIVLNPRPGEAIFDMCAAPGNKTAQIAFMMKQKGSLYANDLNQRRISALKETCHRLGVRNVSVVRADGANIPSKAARFDGVLVDAPCSCEGTSRKHRDIAEELDEELDHMQFQGAQIALLRKAVRLCRPGGRIVYSTCTYAPEENEMVVQTVLSEYRKQLRVVPADIPGMIHSSGVVEWEGEEFSPEMRHCVRIWPHQNDSGGFFVALIEKVAPCPREVDEVSTKKIAGVEHDDEAKIDIIRRYGLAERVFEDDTFFRANTSKTRCVSSDHILFDRIDPETTGLFVMNHKKCPPRFSPSGAMMIGPHATRNVVKLDESQVYGFLKREKVDVAPEQLIYWDKESEVIVRHREWCVGMGHLRSSESGSLFLCSHVPKRSADFLNRTFN